MIGNSSTCMFFWVPASFFPVVPNEERVYGWHHAASISTNLVHLQAMQLTLASFPSTCSTNFEWIYRKFAKENAKQVGHLSPVSNLTVTAAGLHPPHVTNPPRSVCFVSKSKMSGPLPGIGVHLRKVSPIPSPPQQAEDPDWSGISQCSRPISTKQLGTNI